MDKIFSDKINLLKALAIMLVVSGHLEFSLMGIFPPYSFQLSLFFFISGMLFKDKYLNEVGTYLERRVKSLLIPYFSYETFYIGVTTFIFYLTGKWWGMPLTFKNIFITPFLNGHQLDLCCPLWFVPQLFISMIIFLFAMRVLNGINKNRWFHLTFFIILGFCSIPLIKSIPNSPLNLLIFRTAFSMFFIYLGHFYIKYIKDKHDIFTPNWLGAIIIFQSILWLFNRDFDPVHGIGLSYVLVWARFDSQLIVPVLTSLTGIWASLYLIKIIYPYFKDIKFLKQMGENTYSIMANHLLVMYVITAIIFAIKGIPISERNAQNIYWIYDPKQTTYLYFVLTMIISTYIGVLQKKIKKVLTKESHKDT
ncbi:MAG: acyltransferase family protein [Candidatus Gastranaerophilales bacterium]|nr:acyltransferase family protein [Candidatus Gastranaerophilales bacterium]